MKDQNFSYIRPNHLIKSREQRGSSELVGNIHVGTMFQQQPSCFYVILLCRRVKSSPS